MTDTITRLTIPQRVYDRGYHSDLDDLRALIPSLRQHIHSPEFVEAFHVWQRGSQHRIEGRDLRHVRDDSTPVADIGYEELRFAGGFMHWLVVNRRHLVDVGEPAPATPAPLFTPGMTVAAMRAAGIGEVLGSVRAQWLQWCRETSQPDSWPNAVIDDLFMRGEAQGGAWTRDFEAFSEWATRHRDLFAEVVPSGDSTATIGPDTPGWDEFWERVAEYAQEDGYEEQYNTLARAFGATEIDDDTEIEVDIQIRIDPFYVTVRQTMSRTDYNDGDYIVEQSEIDEAIREHIRHNNVDHQIEETEIVS